MKGRAITRREMLRWSAAAAAGALLAACQPKVVEVTKIVEKEKVVEKVVKETVIPPTPVPETVTLTYIDVDETGSGAEAYRVYEEVSCKGFMERHPHVKVVFQPGEGDWSDALIAAMAAGNAADVFLHWTDFGRDLMQKGQMLPLNEHIPIEDQKDFNDEQMMAMHYGPTLYSLPKYVSVPAYAYNKDLLDKAGVPYPDENWDWDRFMGMMDKLAGLGTSELGKLYPTYVIEWCLQGWVWQGGGEWMNKPIDGTKMLINEEKALLGLKLNHDLIFKHRFAPTYAETEGIDWWHPFQTGRFALVEVHSWMTNELVNLGKFRFDFVALPKGPARHAGLIFNDAYAVWAGTKHPKEAVEFLRFITSAEIEKKFMLSIHGWMPSRKSVINAWNTESHGAKKGYNVAAFSQILPNTRMWPMFLEHGKVYNELYRPTWERIWVAGELGLEEGVNQICKQVNEFLATVA